MHTARFERARVAPADLESAALDRSAKCPVTRSYYSCMFLRRTEVIVGTYNEGMLASTNSLAMHQIMNDSL